MAVLGFNADRSWAQVIYNGYSGWCSMQYLSYKEDFGTMTVNYELNGIGATPVGGAVMSPFDTVTVGGEGIYAENYEFLGWTLTRSSDGKSLCADGTWQASCDNNRLFAPGDTLELGFANLNRAATDDTYTFTAQWREIVPMTFTTGDVNGDGVVNMLDLKSLKAYVASSGENIDVRAADCNHDNIINLRDVKALLIILASST